MQRPLYRMQQHSSIKSLKARYLYIFGNTALNIHTSSVLESDKILLNMHMTLLCIRIGYEVRIRINAFNYPLNRNVIKLNHPEKSKIFLMD